MKKLSNKRISELIDKAINDMNEWNNSHTIDEYVINSIRNNFFNSFISQIKSAKNQNDGNGRLIQPLQQKHRSGRTA